MRSLFLGILLFLAAFTSCLDVVHDDEVDKQGDDPTGAPNGPTHRPGQTCTVCHGGKGPGSPDISIGGTVYRHRDTPQPAIGVTVTVTDSSGAKPRETQTNGTGNFYWYRDDWDPTYPLKIHLSGTADDGGTITHDMISSIGGDGGCAHCHQFAGGDQHHMPKVYLE